MDRLRILVCVMIIANLIFAEEVKSDSSALNPLNLLKRQNLFYSAGENWIPPSLLSESECIGVGCCCLMPLGGFFIMREALKKEVPSESLQPDVKPNFSIGIGYSLGIAYRGILSKLLESGEMDPFHNLYCNNQAHFNLSLTINPFLYTKLSGSYIWARIEKTGTPFLPMGGYFCPNDKWEFDGYSFAFSTGWYLKQDKAVQVEIGIASYSWEGTDYVIKAYTFEPVTIIDWGKGICGILSIGVNKYLTSGITCNMNLTTRYSRAKEAGFSASEPVEQLTPVVFHLTGIYLGFEIKYVLKKYKEGVKNESFH